MFFALRKGTADFEGSVSKAITLFCEDTAPIWDICPRQNKTQKDYFYFRGNGETEGAYIPSDQKHFKESFIDIHFSLTEVTVLKVLEMHFSNSLLGFNVRKIF